MEWDAEGVRSIVRFVAHLKLALFGLCAFSLYGCEEPTLESKLIGQWKGAMTLDQASTTNPTLMMIQENFQPTLYLKEDKSFNMTVAVMSIEGTWKVQDKKVILDIGKVGGKSKDAFKSVAAKRIKENPYVPNVDLNQADKPLVFAVDPEAKTLVSQDLSKNLSFLGPLAPAGKITFKRLGSSD